MNEAKKLAWVVVRTIGLLLIIYSFVPLNTAAKKGHSAFVSCTLNQHLAKVETNKKFKALDKLKAQNQLKKAQSDLQFAAILNFIYFLLYLSAGIYCLKRGKILHKLLMPPKERGKIQNEI